MSIIEMIPILQVAIGPAVLISGVGLLILSLTNRLGRVVDRGRAMVRELRDNPQSESPSVEKQLNILARRASLLQVSIVFASLCVLFAAVLIITLFLTAAMSTGNVWIIGGLFVSSMISLIISLIAFLQDTNHSLKAFYLDIKR
jgi:hypothetical protein